MRESSNGIMKSLTNVEISIKNKINYYKTYLETSKAALYMVDAKDADHFEA